MVTLIRLQTAILLMFKFLLFSSQGATNPEESGYSRTSHAKLAAPAFATKENNRKYPSQEGTKKDLDQHPVTYVVIFKDHDAHKGAMRIIDEETSGMSKNDLKRNLNEEGKEYKPPTSVSSIPRFLTEVLEFASAADKVKWFANHEDDIVEGCEDIDISQGRK